MKPKKKKKKNKQLRTEDEFKIIKQASDQIRSDKTEKMLAQNRLITGMERNAALHSWLAGWLAEVFLSS